MNDQVECHFSDLWHRARQKWVSGNITAANMCNGLPIPPDYCLSTIARLVEQKKCPIENIKLAADKLKRVGKGQFFYPNETLHITLLGCTHRFLSKDAFTGERIGRIFKVCSKILNGKSSVTMTLRGIGIEGDRVFVQVFPNEHRWADLRQELEDSLKAIGEEPISYSNKMPVHLNIMRVTNSNQSELMRLLVAIEEIREIEVGELEVSKINFLLTDFVLSAINTEHLGSFLLSPLVIYR